MSQAKFGFAAKAYRQTSGTRAAWPASGSAPNLSEITNLRDVTIPLEKTEVDATTRLTSGWEVVAGALKKGGIDYEMVWDPSDAHCAAFISAFIGNTTVALAFLDQASTTVGAEGLWADFEVLKMEKAEPLNGIQMVKFSVKPGYSAVGPAWITVGA